MKVAVLIVCSVITAALAGPRPFNGGKSECSHGRNTIANNTSTQPMEEMLLHTDNFDAAIAEIESVGGRVTLLFGNDLLVAKVPKHFIDEKKSFASASAHIAESASPETLMFVQAYWMAREKKTKPQPRVQLWTGETVPGPLPQKSRLVGEANLPYPQTMTGKVAVGLLMISGPGSLAISDAERTSIVSAVTTGYQFWTSFAPNYANLKFHLIHSRITVATADIGTCHSYSHCEDGITNDALNAIGYPSGLAGQDALAQFYKDISGSDSAYLVFFTKYNLYWPFYAFGGGGPIYMQIGKINYEMDKLFAHETGHVFNAPDEYDSRRCKCHEAYGKGSCTAENYNCVTCGDIQTNCIMKYNDFDLCGYTRLHVGWCS